MAAEGDAIDMPAGLPSARRLAVRVGVFVALLVVVALTIRSLPGLSDVRARLSNATPTGIATIAALELGSVLGFVAAFRGAFSNIPPWPVAIELGTGEQAANVLLPAGGVGGLALGALVARDASVPHHIAVTRTVALFLVTSAVTFVGIAVGGIVASLSAGSVPWYGSTLPAVLAVLVLAGVASLPSVLPEGSGRLRRRVSTGTRAGIRAVLALAREPNLSLLVGATAYFALDVGALAAAFHAVGADAPPFGSFLLAYALGQVGGLLPLPGGIGGVDGGLIAMFAIYGADLGGATAAVLAYRLFQLGLPVLCGSLGIAAYARRRATRRDPPAIAARFEYLLDSCHDAPPAERP